MSSLALEGNVTVKELIAKLATMNQDATVDVVAHNQGYDFSVCAGGGGEGQPFSEAPEVSFYVDALCQSESIG